MQSNKGTKSTGPEILLELNEMHSAVVAYSYLANVLAKRHQARIVAYSDSPASAWKIIFNKLFVSSIQKIYSSFNVSEFMLISVCQNQQFEVKRLLAELHPKLRNKSDVERLEIDGVLIGDLVYDTFLRQENLPTVDLRNSRFIGSLRSSIEKFVFWKSYFDEHDVRAINISHCVYDQALPLRIAVSKDIPVYQINATHAYRLNSSNLHAYTDFKYFPEYFSRLAEEVRDRGLREAEQRLERRFAGEVGVDMSYSSKSAFTAEIKEPVLRKSMKTKVLVATHCFFDSPHPYGFNLFPDFHEWLGFLGELSERTDYDWYLKTHPDFLPGNIELIDEFLSHYPRITQIASDTSHKQIIQEGIDYALTVYGTIGFEYAALGVPVINASMSNPHVAYKFNLHPETIEEYENILMSLSDLKFEIEKQKVYEYYFMKHIYNTNNWLFDNHKQMVQDLGGYSEQFTSRVYEYWMQQWTSERHAEILAAITSFIDSGEFRMGNKHLGQDFEFTVERGL